MFRAFSITSSTVGLFRPEKDIAGIVNSLQDFRGRPFPANFSSISEQPQILQVSSALGFCWVIEQNVALSEGIFQETGEQDRASFWWCLTESDA